MNTLPSPYDTGVTCFHYCRTNYILSFFLALLHNEITDQWIPSFELMLYDGPMKQSFDHSNAPVLVATLFLNSNPNAIPNQRYSQERLLTLFYVPGPCRYATCNIPPFDCEFN